jgi:hypothetical protein
MEFNENHQFYVFKSWNLRFRSLSERFELMVLHKLRPALTYIFHKNLSRLMFKKISTCSRGSQSHWGSAVWALRNCYHVCKIVFFLITKIKCCQVHPRMISWIKVRIWTLTKGFVGKKCQFLSAYLIWKWRWWKIVCVSVQSNFVTFIQINKWSPSDHQIAH